MEGYNKVQLLGNLGAEPELKHGDKGMAVLKLRLATTSVSFSDSGEKKERTDWHSVTVFGKRAEGLAKILASGSRIFVEGRLQTSSYEKDGKKVWKTEVVANNILLAGGAKASGQHEKPKSAYPSNHLDRAEDANDDFDF